MRIMIMKILPIEIQCQILECLLPSPSDPKLVEPTEKARQTTAAFRDYYRTFTWRRWLRRRVLDILARLDAARLQPGGLVFLEDDHLESMGFLRQMTRNAKDIERCKDVARVEDELYELEKRMQMVLKRKARRPSVHIGCSLS